jgi:hypothetical protein
MGAIIHRRRRGRNARRDCDRCTDPEKRTTNTLICRIAHLCGPKVAAVLLATREQRGEQMGSKYAR